MAERWRKPVIPIDFVTVDQGIVFPDGRERGVVAPVLRPEDIERARLGYVCLNCLEPHEEAWPVKCNFCGAPIREKQAAFFAREFTELQVGPSTTIDDELAGLDERRRKEEERNGSTN